MQEIFLEDPNVKMIRLTTLSWRENSLDMSNMNINLSLWGLNWNDKKD